jgi:hypothetical protein
MTIELLIGIAIGYIPCQSLLLFVVPVSDLFCQSLIILVRKDTTSSLRIFMDHF